MYQHCYYWQENWRNQCLSQRRNCYRHSRTPASKPAFLHPRSIPPALIPHRRPEACWRAHRPDWTGVRLAAMAAKDFFFGGGGDRCPERLRRAQGLKQRCGRRRPGILRARLDPDDRSSELRSEMRSAGPELTNYPELLERA